MAKQIKAYVEVEPYVEVVQGRGSDPSESLATILVDDDFGDALSRVAGAAIGAASAARVLSGPHGCGKSTLLTALVALAGFPDLRSRSQPAMRRAASDLSATKLVPVFVDMHEAATRELVDMLGESVREASAPASAAGVAATEWEHAASTSDPIASSLALLPPGGRIVLVVDGLSAWSRAASRDAVRRAVATLLDFGELATRETISTLVALDEESLDASGPFVQLLRVYQIEYLGTGVLKQICDRHLFRKDAKQRTELSSVYDVLRRLVPRFRWTREDFVALYPLHPASIEVASDLRRLAPSFSFPRFAATSANRAKGRRERSLVVLDELFDTAEYELRKAADLAPMFEVYDDLANAVVPKLGDNQQRFWAKLVLKGLFLYSLARRGVAAADLAAALLLYDEEDVEVGPQAVATILSAFEARAAHQFVVEGEGASRTYRLPSGEEGAGARIVDDVAGGVAAKDPRVADVLVTLGALRFPDWPVELGAAPGSAPLEIPWHGTWRAGLLSYRVPTTVVPIPPLEGDVPLAEIDTVADLVDGMLDDEFEIPEPSIERMVVAYEANTNLCEHDWEISVVPAGSAVERRNRPATVVWWAPAEPNDAELQVLRRLVALRSDDPRIAAIGAGREALVTEAEAEGGLVFHNLYLERGRFVGLDWEAAASDQAARETVSGLLADLLEAPLTRRYPQHPAFAGELDDASARIVVQKFLAGGATTPSVLQVAGALASPLGLADTYDHGPLRFNPSGERALAFAFNVEPLRLAENAGEQGVPLDAVYQALRREPFGLQRAAQRIVLAALVATKRVKLVGPNGELEASGLAFEPELEGYTHLKRSGLSVYSNETLLEWARLVADAGHLNDLVTADGRRLIRQALADWLDRWHALNLGERFASIPAEAATRRTWQLVSASRQYFDVSASTVRAILDEEVSLEEGLGRIVTTFAANPTIYQRAVRDLRMLASFVDWVQPFYTSAKEYVLCADRTSEPRIETHRTELVDFISSPHRLLDESKRRRFETVYDAFRRDYVDYYVSAHDLHVGSRADFDALDGYLDEKPWQAFELLSHVRVVNGRHYQFAEDFVRTIRDLGCQLPTRELLQDRPTCVCGFRLGSPDGFARLFERLRLFVEHGTREHVQTIRQFRQPILAGLRGMEADSVYADASVPLIGLLTSADDVRDLTPSTVELVNRCLGDQPLSVTVTSPPALELGRPIAKDELRARLARWLDELPGNDGVLVEISRSLPVGSDE